MENFSFHYCLRALGIRLCLDSFVYENLQYWFKITEKNELIHFEKKNVWPLGMVLLMHWLCQCARHA